MGDKISDLTHDELEQRIRVYKEELPKCNQTQRNILRHHMKECYERLVREGRYSTAFLAEIIRHRKSGFSAEYAAEAMAKFPQYVSNTREASYADTQSEYKTAEKALVELVKDLWGIVDEVDVKDESHLKIIQKLVK